MGKASTKFKIGEPLIYKYQAGSLTGKEEMVVVMDHYGDFQTKLKKVPVLWTTTKLRGAWYMCPIRFLRRPTSQELLAWKISLL